MFPAENTEEPNPLTHEAEKRLIHDVQRDAKKARKMPYDEGMEIERDGEKTETETGTDRLHDAF